MADGLNPRQAEKKQRPIHVYKLPPSLANGVTSVGMVEITADEELVAEKRAHGERARVAIELTKQAIAEANGKPVSLADGTTDSLWNGLSPKVRTLLVSAYSKLHIPDDTETEGFFESMEVKL